MQSFSNFSSSLIPCTPIYFPTYSCVSHSHCSSISYTLILILNLSTLEYTLNFRLPNTSILLLVFLSTAGEFFPFKISNLAFKVSITTFNNVSPFLSISWKILQFHYCQIKYPATATKTCHWKQLQINFRWLNINTKQKYIAMLNNLLLHKKHML